MSINETEDKKIVFNTPINFNASEEFPELSIKDLPKVEYLLNQINWCTDYRGYQVHVGNHAWSLCLNRGEVSSILSKLVKLNIIQKATAHNPGLNSNGYKMVTPFSNENSNKSFYRVEDYLFLQKLKADKWVAKGKEHSAFVKTPKKLDAAAYANAEALQARIKLLEQLLMANGISIPPVMAVVQSKPELAPVVRPKHTAQPEVPPEIKQPVMASVDGVIKKLNQLNENLKFDLLDENNIEVTYLSMAGLVTDFTEIKKVIERLPDFAKAKLFIDALDNKEDSFSCPLLGTSTRIYLSTINVNGVVVIGFGGVAA